MAGAGIADRDVRLAVLQHGVAVLADQLQLDVGMSVREGGLIIRGTVSNLSPMLQRQESADDVRTQRPKGRWKVAAAAATGTTASRL
ncbi:MAG TPA: hypothetical protein VNO35_01415, partial [Steroidobacteraceae bacterium]|nr:hypothetical protein [Steroidobacteraceae bacterium]